MGSQVEVMIVLLAVTTTAAAPNVSLRCDRQGNAAIYMRVQHIASNGLEIMTVSCLPRLEMKIDSQTIPFTLHLVSIDESCAPFKMIRSTCPHRRPCIIRRALSSASQIHQLERRKKAKEIVDRFFMTKSTLSLGFSLGCSRGQAPKSPLHVLQRLIINSITRWQVHL